MFWLFIWLDFITSSLEISLYTALGKENAYELLKDILVDKELAFLECFSTDPI